MSLDPDTEAEGTGSQHFVELYRVEYPGMVRLAHALTGSAEDLVQEAFARVHGRTEFLENPGGYLRTTVVNLCRDRERRGRREKNLPLRLPSVVTLSLGASELMDVLLRLPYRERAVLVMRYWGDWTEREIADALNCRPGTVKSLASRGLAHLTKEVSQ